MWYEELLDRDLVPDWIVRQAIRRKCRARLDKESQGTPTDLAARRSAFLKELRASPVALHTDLANVQHYEVPPSFFGAVLGPRRKYSCCLWSEGATSLAEAEEHMLALTATRAGLADGQRILDLGCGWGSLALYAAERFPAARVLAVSNSRDQRRYIEGEAARRGFENLEVRTADMNDFATDERFDRVVSIEMFEHMKNYGELLRRIAGWLAPGGALFVHIFVHRALAYHYQAEGPDDWMAQHFFTGGTMPSWDLLDEFADHLQVVERWPVAGPEYQRTCEAWLERMDARRDTILPILDDTYGADQITRWWVRWRVFFMACAELFGFRGGREWFVGHYLLRPVD